MSQEKNYRKKELNCDLVSRVAMNYVSLELRTPNDERIKAHTMICSDCYDEINTLKIGADAVRSIPEWEIPRKAYEKAVNRGIEEALKELKKETPN